MAIDESREFKPLNIAVITLSDTRTEENDRSGQTLVDLAQSAGHAIVRKQIIPDELNGIVTLLKTLCADPAIDIVLCTGGTGLTDRDVTPEAFQAVVEKDIPGFGELFRMLSFDHIGTSTIQSRATAGLAQGTFLFALPGSTGACKDAWKFILKEQLDIRHRPCNFAELLPRFAGTPQARKTGIKPR